MRLCPGHGLADNKADSYSSKRLTRSHSTKTQHSPCLYAA